MRTLSLALMWVGTGLLFWSFLDITNIVRYMYHDMVRICHNLGEIFAAHPLAAVGIGSYLTGVFVMLFKKPKWCKA